MLLTVVPPVCVAYYSTKKSMKITLAESPKRWGGGNPHHPTEQPTETIKPVGVCNDINFNNILNRRPASSASNADKNRGHRIDCLLCQITGNNDAEMGVEGGGR